VVFIVGGLLGVLVLVVDGRLQVAHFQVDVFFLDFIDLGGNGLRGVLDGASLSEAGAEHVMEQAEALVGVLSVVGLD